MKHKLILSLLACGLVPAPACMLTFSVDPYSSLVGFPSIPPPPVSLFGPSDILAAGYWSHVAEVVVPAHEISPLLVMPPPQGRPPANMDAYAYQLPVDRNGLLFSVDRFSQGKPGTDVNLEASKAAAAADVYIAKYRPDGTHYLMYDEWRLGLQTGDNIDGLDYSPGTFFPAGGVDCYYSLDRETTSRPWYPAQAGDILLNGQVVWEGTRDIGLQPGDDLDALLFLDAGALFSISRDSPSALTAGGWVSPADILYTDFLGNYGVWARADDLGLLPTDDLDALAFYVPECNPLYPLSVLTAIITLVQWRRRSARRTQE